MRQLVFLIGYRGTGKTTVAQLLADKLGWQVIDADELLEKRAGRTIRVIFATDGEAAFRDMEATILTELCGLERHVVATGGGVVLRSENRQQMRSSGFIVWLTADATTICRRLQADLTTSERRPPLTVGGLAEVEGLLQAREPLYRGCADLILDTTAQSPEQIADAILNSLPAGVVRNRLQRYNGPHLTDHGAC